MFLFEPLFSFAYSTSVMLTVAVIAPVVVIIFIFFWFSDTKQFMQESFQGFMMVCLCVVESAIIVPFVWLPLILIGLLVGSFYLLWRYVISNDNSRS